MIRKIKIILLLILVFFGCKNKEKEIIIVSEAIYLYSDEKLRGTYTVYTTLTNKKDSIRLSNYADSLLKNKTLNSAVGFFSDRNRTPLVLDDHSLEVSKCCDAMFAVYRYDEEKGKFELSFNEI